ncbi:MAG: NAD-dependent epimerase/dehydratase family protein, partial [Candidatus Helarchaeota archaeon]
MKKILVTGSSGQVGSELVPELLKKYGQDNVFTMDIKDPLIRVADHFIKKDATDIKNVKEVIKKYDINIIYHLVGLLSAGSEKDPELSWKINIESFRNILDLARDLKIEKIFWPSSIGAFGLTTPQENTPQHTILEPTTMYGVEKVAGELLANYYFNRWGLDVRSMRYPGLITATADPADGTTEYSEWIFYDAVEKGKYECFLKEDARLPMM